MSVEKDLLVRAKVLLECLNTEPLQDQADIIIGEIKELLAQPEPFMFKDRKSTGSLIVHDAMYKRGYARAELDLKREPLSEEAVSELLMDGFSTHLMDLVRMIEKAHGIGGGE